MRFKGYRTIVLNVLVGVGLILASPDVMNLIPPSGMKWVVAAQAVLNIALRIITTTPMGQVE